MENLNGVEMTLFVPLLGRIFASKYFPQIFYDAKALALERLVPAHLPEKRGSDGIYSDSGSCTLC